MKAIIISAICIVLAAFTTVFGIGYAWGWFSMRKQNIKCPYRPCVWVDGQLPVSEQAEVEEPCQR